MSRRLTAKQRDILGIAAGSGPVSAGEVERYHLPGVPARSTLNTLEKRALIEASYSLDYRTGRYIREYSLTAEGQDALDAALETTPEDTP